MSMGVLRVQSHAAKSSHNKSTYRQSRFVVGFLLGFVNFSVAGA